jgi:hypothetical protein
MIIHARLGAKKRLSPVVLRGAPRIKSPAMTTDQETILAFVEDHLATLSHKLDSTLRVVQQLPNWQTKIQEALNDPQRIQMTNAKLQPLYRLFDGFRLGVLGNEEFLTLVSELRATQD